MSCEMSAQDKSPADVRPLNHLPETRSGSGCAEFTTLDLATISAAEIVTSAVSEATTSGHAGCAVVQAVPEGEGFKKNSQSIQCPATILIYDFDAASFLLRYTPAGRSSV